MRGSSHRQVNVAINMTTARLPFHLFKLSMVVQSLAVRFYSFSIGFSYGCCMDGMIDVFTQPGPLNLKVLLCIYLKILIPYCCTTLSASIPIMPLFRESWISRDGEGRSGRYWLLCMKVIIDFLINEFNYAY